MPAPQQLARTLHYLDRSKTSGAVIMANKALFASTRGPRLADVNVLNHTGAGAYDYFPKHKLAQYAATGCLSNTFYASANEQLETVLKLARELEPEFLAKAAVYARKTGPFNWEGTVAQW